MTHFEKELERLKEGFEKWCDNELDAENDGGKVAGRILFPFVSYVLNHPEHSAEKTALLNNFKANLGMDLFAHERVGLEPKRDELSVYKWACERSLSWLESLKAEDAVKEIEKIFRDNGMEI